MDADNRRSSTRYPVDLVGVVRLGEEPHDVRITNLSLGGAFVTGLDRQQMGTQVWISFEIPTYEGPIEATATTRWCTEFGVGVQFGSLRAREVWSLNKFFESLSLS